MVFRDVTQARQIAQQLSWQAGHDSLTGLANRYRFEEILTETLMDLSRHHHVLCYLDLDRFKIVNDTCGHNAGDKLLQQVALLIQKQVRHVDTFARLGGDEFGLILYGCRIHEAITIAEKIRTVIQAFQFVWEGNTFQIGISIGLVRLNANMLDPLSAVSAADAACYKAKAKGRNRIQLYQADDADILQQRGQQQWSLRIKQALDQDRFCLFSQPIRPTHPGSDIHHYEILLRMIDENGELIPPGQFIPAAERYDLMVAIDRWVVTRCLEYLAHPATMATDNVYMINLSGVSLGDEDFLVFLTDQLATIPLSHQAICFEITETAAVRNLSQAADFMRHLKQLGLSFALDDFGTGMSSFAYLKSLPIDYVKIDGKFISDMTVDDTAIAIVESIHNVVRVMGLQTIAEFVETPTICNLVQQIGIDFMQGYHIARPSPLLLAP